MAKRSVVRGEYCPHCGRIKVSKSVYCSIACRQGRYRVLRRAKREGWASMLQFDQIDGLLKPISVEWIGGER
jgi:hypothetical protein